jgi:anti-anti-sigma regulatory factor
MRALNKGNIAIFKPQGFLDGTNAPTFMTIEDIQATEKLKVDMILVSLEKVIFFNKNGLDIFAKLLVSLRNKMHITVGFCDYDATKFDTIMKFYHNDINFSLFSSNSF